MANRQHDTNSFDIVQTYRELLTSDRDLTMPVAAIESLVRALSAQSTSTISETLEHLESLSHTLIASTANPISLSAGTDLFQRYLTSSLQQRAGPLRADAPDFDNIRSHLVRNARLFVERAKATRDRIAGFGRHFVRDGMTILTSGGSRVVGALLSEAADASGGSVRFKVIYVLSSSTQSSTPEGADIVASLRRKGVPVATITEGAVGYALGKVDMVIVGAEGVVENGGVISRLGTYQIGLLAKAADKPFYVVAESHKFVRIYPLGQYDLPIDQRVIEFKVEDDKIENEGKKLANIDEAVVMDIDDAKTEAMLSNGLDDAVDFTVSSVLAIYTFAILTFVASGTDHRDYLRERSSFAQCCE
jgi:translation initiation factor eIF-2B subunit alpha